MVCVGIDLGTSNSVIAYLKDGVPTLIPNALGETLTPSAVTLSDQDEILVGQAALDRLITHPRRTAAGFKRLMGTNATLTLGDHSFRPEELSALVLRALLEIQREGFSGRLACDSHSGCGRQNNEAEWPTSPV
ncbi:Hsp70 family protein, partial [Asaia siamensis]